MEWKIAYAQHGKWLQNHCCTIKDLEQSGFDIVSADVPGNFELDLMKAKKLEDLYYSTNTLKAQELEDIHLWYYTTVEIADANQYLCFEGIDTYADIYINGELVQSTNNMFLAYDVYADWKMGINEIVVHIKPTVLEARKYELPVKCYAFKYNYASLHTRKAPHMYGWDIMPRIVSGGIWKPVTLKKQKVDYIKEVYVGTNEIDLEQNTAQLRFFVTTDISAVNSREFTLKIDASCGNSSYSATETLWHNAFGFTVDVKDCKFWWPKNAGEPNLYDCTISLIRNSEVCDTYSLKHGIRMIELERTDITDNEGNGDFCFRVNGKKIFVMGTNWVPLDAFHSNDLKRLPKAMELLEDIGCNMLRCWGGNVYESDEFFDYCDEHGIMVWQDFSLGCAVYPEDDDFLKLLQEEAVYQIKRLRNHASLALWAGDNEVDIAHAWSGYELDPNRNYINRVLLRRAVEAHDYFRTYLPSSPYVCKKAFKKEGILPEEHLWGPRDYFKGDFYKNTFCHFASEMGYHGFNSPESLKRFLAQPEKIFEDDGTPTAEYLVHATSMELDEKAPFGYRIRLAHDQVVTLFGKAEENLEDFIRQSQISQAEAKKYFIEKFRTHKWKQTGIIWWNLLDGWPQVSDAVVDYYYTKKLAFHYIKRSQEPVCLMFDEPENETIRLVAVNDLPVDKMISYAVKKYNASANDDIVIVTGQATLAADTAMTLDTVAIAENEKAFYYIEWEMDGKTYKNHYFTNIINIDYRMYMKALEKYEMNQFEGF